MTIRAKTLNSCLEALRDEHQKGVTFISSKGTENFMSYAALWESALGILHNLQKAGLGPGDELVFQIPENESFIKIFWACLLGKIIPVPISIAHKPEAMEKLLKTWTVLQKPSLIAPGEMIDAIGPLLNKNFPELAAHILSNTIPLNEALAVGASAIPETVVPSDLCYIQFSSGSTGKPKGVMLSHENLIVNIEDMITAADITSEDKILSWLPLTHDMGLIGQHLRPLFLGIPTYLIPPQVFMRHPLMWMDKTSEHRATLLCAPNFGFQYLVSALQKAETRPDWDLSCLRLVYNGAEPISLPVVSTFVAALQPFGMRQEALYPVYGLAEASLAAAHPLPGSHYQAYHIDRYKMNLGQKVTFLSGPEDPLCATFFDTGYPMPQCPLRIANDADEPLPEDTIGHIQMKGANVCLGYYRNPEATNALFTEDGWCRTGDLGFLHEGRLCITGRAKELIIIRGQNYYPSDLEDALTDIPGTGPGRAVACGYQNEKEGSESLLLFVAFKKEMEAFLPLIDKVKSRINDVIGLSVEEVIPIRRIMRTTSGKVQRFAMVKRWEKGEFDEDLNKVRALAAKENTLLHSLADMEEGSAKAEIADILFTEACKLVPLPEAARDSTDSAFFKSGFDSLLLTRYQGAVEKRFAGLRVPVSLFFKYQTIPAMAAHLHEGMLEVAGKAPARSGDALMDQVKQMSDAEIEALLNTEE